MPRWEGRQLDQPDAGQVDRQALARHLAEAARAAGVEDLVLGELEGQGFAAVMRWADESWESWAIGMDLNCWPEKTESFTRKGWSLCWHGQQRKGIGFTQVIGEWREGDGRHLPAVGGDGKWHPMTRPEWARIGIEFSKAAYEREIGRKV